MQGENIMSEIELKKLYRQYNNLAGQSVKIIDSLKKVIEKNDFIEVIGSGFTYLKFKYCNRQFFIRCCCEYKIEPSKPIEVTGTAEWYELKKKFDGSYEEWILFTDDFDEMGNIQRVLATEYGQLFFEKMYNAITKYSDKKFIFPLE